MWHFKIFHCTPASSSFIDDDDDNDDGDDGEEVDGSLDIDGIL